MRTAGLSEFDRRMLQLGMVQAEQARLACDRPFGALVVRLDGDAGFRPFSCPHGLF
ncbi:hypothetical protein [Craterilacuibacter sp.]|uniref:hypothetical protein n=1 Tax=Craterilacuibacter sp. TaxID=2870909 RepID=UPI003F358AB7